jgi:hypothetical protein
MNFELKKKATTMIKHLYELKNLIDEVEANTEENKNSRETKLRLDMSMNKYRTSLNHFKNFRQYVITKEHENSTEAILNKLDQTVTNEMEDLINISHHQMINLIQHINLSKSFQEQINSYVDQIEKLTVGLHVTVKKDSKEIK